VFLVAAFFFSLDWGAALNVVGRLRFVPLRQYRQIVNPYYDQARLIRIRFVLVYTESSAIAS
jgi:hypothetical protein